MHINSSSFNTAFRVVDSQKNSQKQTTNDIENQSTSINATQAKDQKDTAYKTNRNQKDSEINSELLKLQSRDLEVKSHEMAHKAVGGSLASSMSFEYQTGPDGKQYAIGGEVSIDSAPESDPKATQSKMRQVRAAALAPANPSPQDIKVASSATLLEMKAKMDELKNKQQDTSSDRQSETSITNQEISNANSTSPDIRLRQQAIKVYTENMSVA